MRLNGNNYFGYNSKANCKPTEVLKCLPPFYDASGIPATIFNHASVTSACRPDWLRDKTIYSVGAKTSCKTLRWVKQRHATKITVQLYSKHSAWKKLIRGIFMLSRVTTCPDWLNRPFLRCCWWEVYHLVMARRCGEAGNNSEHKQKRSELKAGGHGLRTVGGARLDNNNNVDDAPIKCVLHKSTENLIDNQRQTAARHRWLSGNWNTRMRQTDRQKI